MSFIYGDGGRETQGGQSSNSYANGDNQNCGNVITDRPSIKLHHAPGGNSQISFGGYDQGPPQQYQQSYDAPPQGYGGPPPSSGGGQSAGDDYYKKMTVQELRKACRERGLNPGGGREQLHERLTEAVKSGACEPVMIGQSDGPDHVMSSNNFARPDGQNTGNFLTDRNSSRVLAAPGGASTICFGSEEPSRPSSKGHSVQKVQEISGHDIFGGESENYNGPQRSGGVRKDPGGGSSLVLG